MSTRIAEIVLDSPRMIVKQVRKEPTESWESCFLAGAIITASKKHRSALRKRGKVDHSHRLTFFDLSQSDQKVIIDQLEVD